MLNHVKNCELENFNYFCFIQLLGSISPTFVRQAKIRRRTAFGKNFVIQFHQHNYTIFIGLNFFYRPAVYLTKIWLIPTTETICQEKYIRHNVFIKEA